MLAHETVLRQKYSFSFFTTTLLIALTTESSLAFSINTVRTDISENWNTEQTYTLGDQRTGITQLSPTPLRSITRGGTTLFLRTLRESFGNWNFNVASNDLAGSFDVSTYDARYGVTDQGFEYAGGALQLQYIPGAGDPTPLGNTIHWIQRVFNNHRLSDPNPDDGHDRFADIIDIGPGVTNPYYDTVFTADEINFFDLSSREANRNHSWVAELYLVEETAPQQVTIYNGIQWGWGNRVEPVPEPLTIFGSGMGVGLGVLFKKYSRKENKKSQKAKTLV
jgi:hypothetical protein